MAENKKMGRPPIANRKKPMKAKYHYRLNLVGIHRADELQEKLSEVAGRKIPKPTIAKWEIHGWPPDKWDMLLSVLKLTDEQAKTALFETQEDGFPL